MAFGKLRKIWDKIKTAGKKVFGFVKNKILPIAKVVAPVVATAWGGPGAGLVATKGLDIAGTFMDNAGSGDWGKAVGGLTSSLPAWRG
jgi:hypothetical protein